MEVYNKRRLILLLIICLIALILIIPNNKKIFKKELDRLYLPHVNIWTKLTTQTYIRKTTKR